MEINGKVYCFFEQSGTFKNEFKKLGYEAEDYDIQNNFGETDNIVDLFAEIERGYNNEPSIFDKIRGGGRDLIIAFFPCIYFCEMSALHMTYDHLNYKNLSIKEKTDKILERSQNREYFYSLIIKLVAMAKIRNLRLIIENPYSQLHYLIAGQNFIIKPSLIDKNRLLRGDYYKKPTMYFFINCEHTNGFTYQKDKEQLIIHNVKSGIKAGICSEERSMISPDYARNFICDFIIGKKQDIGQLSLF